MRIFEEFPEASKCPICNTNAKGQCCLVAVDGTDEGDGNYVAKVVHIDCLELWFTTINGTSVIYQTVEEVTGNGDAGETTDNL